VPSASFFSLAFAAATSSPCFAAAAASSAFCLAERAKLFADANIPAIDDSAFSAGSSLTTAAWPARLASTAALSPCTFRSAGLAPAPSSALTSSALPILAAVISAVVPSSET